MLKRHQLTQPLKRSSIEVAASFRSLKNNRPRPIDEACVHNSISSTSTPSATAASTSPRPSGKPEQPQPAATRFRSSAMPLEQAQPMRFASSASVEPVGASSRPAACPPSPEPEAEPSPCSSRHRLVFRNLDHGLFLHHRRAYIHPLPQFKDRILRAVDVEYLPLRNFVLLVRSIGQCEDHVSRRVHMPDLSLDRAYRCNH